MSAETVADKYLNSQRNWITKYVASRQLELIDKNVDRWVAGKTIIDVGCGNGVLEALYKSVASEFTSTDLVDQNIFGIKVNIYSAESLPYESNRFDTLFLIGVIEHIENKRRALQECCRVIKLNGKMILVTSTGLFWRVMRYVPYYKQSIREHADFGKKELYALLPSQITCEKVFSVVPTMFSMFEFTKVKE